MVSTKCPPQRHRRLCRRSYVGGTGRVVLLGREREKAEEEGKVDRFVRGSLRGLRSSWVLFDNSCPRHWSVLDQMVVFPSGPYWHSPSPSAKTQSDTTNRRGARTIKHNKS